MLFGFMLIFDRTRFIAGWGLILLLIAVYPANILYIGTQNKRIYRVDDADVGDPSVVQLPNITTGGNSYCTDIAINPTNTDEIMVVFSNYSVYSLFHSIDGGQSWNKAAGNLEQNNSGSGNGPSCRDAEINPGHAPATPGHKAGRISRDPTRKNVHYENNRIQKFVLTQY